MQETYAISDKKSGKELRRCHIVDGEVCEVGKKYNADNWDAGVYMFYHALSYEKILKKATIFKDTKLPKVSKVYCLNGTPSHDGMVIYFETDQGDYVFYRAETIDIYNAYLFPLDVFYNVTGKLAEVRKENAMKEGRPILENIFEPSELEPYLVGEINWD